MKLILIEYRIYVLRFLHHIGRITSMQYYNTTKKMLKHEDICMYNHTQKHIRLAKGTYRYIAFNGCE